MTAPKKTPAQLDREVAAILAERAAERRNPTTASGIVRKLLGNARRLITRQRSGDYALREPESTLDKLSNLAAAAVAAADRELSTARLSPRFEEIWKSHFSEAQESARKPISSLRALRSDPASYARDARQRFSSETSPDLATALHYVAALEALVPALRRIEAMIERKN